MRWINYAAIVCVLSACASQDPVIPQDGREMTAIYRQALGGPAPVPPTVFSDEASALCRQLPVKTELAACIQQARTILETQRVAIQPNGSQQTLDYLPYTRTAANEVEQLFPRMPNPDLVIYIYPHLATRTRAPIPGYTSVIPLFDRVEYQLPGERPPLD